MPLGGLHFLGEREREREREGGGGGVIGIQTKPILKYTNANMSGNTTHPFNCNYCINLQLFPICSPCYWAAA